MWTSTRPALAALALSSALIAAPALAETQHFTADLSGKSEVPPNDTTGTGTADITYDTETKTLQWTVTYEGLTGPATAAHFHGPANPEENAKPILPLEGDPSSPIKGNKDLTAEQADSLQKGMWYVNIHTEANPNGEIRGQVVPADGTVTETDKSNVLINPKEGEGGSDNDANGSE